jgi:hypothetical protein
MHFALAGVKPHTGSAIFRIDHPRCAATHRRASNLPYAGAVTTHRGFGLLILLVMMGGAAACSRVPAMPRSDLGTRALRHIHALAGLGTRTATTRTEWLAADYVATAFEQAGVRVTVEPFQLRTFSVNTVRLLIAGVAVPPIRLGLNPYNYETTFRERGVVVRRSPSGELVEGGPLRDRVVLASDESAFYDILARGPKAIIFIDHGPFEAFANEPEVDIDLEVEGTSRVASSVNVVATLAGTTADPAEVIVSAQLDSHRSAPAADDDASAAILIELARRFARRGRSCCTVRFIAFGAEELGLAGARVYLFRHQTELRSCELVLNLEAPAGEGVIMAETRGGPSSFPAAKAMSRFPAYLQNVAWEDIDGKWRLVEPALVPTLQVANVPDWLVASFERAANRLATELRHTGRLGSNQQVFAQAGITASGIAVLGDRANSDPSASNGGAPVTMRMTGRLAAAVVDDAIARLCPSR